MVILNRKFVLKYSTISIPNLIIIQNPFLKLNGLLQKKKKGWTGTKTVRSCSLFLFGNYHVL